MSADYDIPMFGQVTLNWSAGADEDGFITGYIGVPEQPGELFDSEGVTLAFREDITGYSDERLRDGVRITLQECINREVVPLLSRPMLIALQELRERAGGYRPEENEAESA